MPIFLSFLLIGLYTEILIAAPICMTGKLELALPEYKTAFLNAVDLALSEQTVNSNVQIKNFFYDNKPLAAIRTYKKMLRENCAAIIGFEYLNDLLLITKIQSDDKIPIFTSYASSTTHDKLPKNIFMFMPTYDYQAQKMLMFLRAKFKKINKILIITEVDRADLVKYKLTYESLLLHEKKQYDSFDFIGTDDIFVKKLTDFIKGKTYNFVLVLSGATGSTKIINLMNNHKTIFIGTENFGSSTNQSLFVRLDDKKINAFTIRNLDFLKENKSLTNYRYKYINKYSAMPNPLSAYVYDSMKIILNTIQKKQAINTDYVLATTFNGITGVSIKKGKFYRSKEYVILSIREKGFVYEQAQ